MKKKKRVQIDMKKPCKCQYVGKWDDSQAQSVFLDFQL